MPPRAEIWGISKRPRRWSVLRWAAPRVRALDVVANGVLLVLAVLSGLQVLWVSDPVWGGANAILVAVLWGAGLQTVSGVAFEGIAGMREKLQK
jgi:hypothetical protein